MLGCIMGDDSWIGWFKTRSCFKKGLGFGRMCMSRIGKEHGGKGKRAVA